jgi:hypothetical protein
MLVVVPSALLFTPLQPLLLLPSFTPFNQFLNYCQTRLKKLPPLESPTHSFPARPRACGFY